MAKFEGVPQLPVAQDCSELLGWARNLGSKLLLEGQLRAQTAVTECLYLTPQPGNIKNYAWKSK